MKQCDLCEAKTDCLYELKFYKPYSEIHDSIDTCLDCHLKIHKFVYKIKDDAIERRLLITKQIEEKIKETRGC
jgi:hypothetical protein